MRWRWIRKKARAPQPRQPMAGPAGVSSRPACDSFPDKSVDRVEPTITDRIPFEKWFVLGFREFDQGAIGQQPRRSTVGGGFDKRLDPWAGQQDRDTDPGEKLRPAQSRH